LAPRKATPCLRVYIDLKLNLGLLHYTDELLKNMDDKKISVIVLLDMSEAFDSIRHDLMMCKLHKGVVPINISGGGTKLHKFPLSLCIGHAT